MKRDRSKIRVVAWVGSAKDDLKGFPEEVQDEIGHALLDAQSGGKSPNAKPFNELGPGTSVMKIVADHDGDTYRVAYTVRLEMAVYVLHCFQKKSPHGIETPKKELDTIKARLQRAKETDAQLVRQKRRKGA